MNQELQREIDALKMDQLQQALSAMQEVIDADTILLKRLLAGMDLAREQRNGYIKNAFPFGTEEQIAGIVEDCDHEIDLILADIKKAP
jgi:hypothetical protein